MHGQQNVKKKYIYLSINRDHLLQNTFHVAIHVEFLLFSLTANSMEWKAYSYLTQESFSRWHVKRAHKLTLHLFKFSLHLELLGGSYRYITDVANYAMRP